jgi:hypothetical protein
MQGEFLVADIREALDRSLFPTVTLWNRLEGRPRRADFDRALKAEVRDALWMLTKQWQMGEFEGDDAGWPIFAKVRVHTGRVTKYKAAEGAAVKFDETTPLEAVAEQMPLKLAWAGRKMRLDLRVQLGRQWAKMLTAGGLNAYVQRYRDRYPFTLPARDESSDYVYAHREAWQQYAAIAGRLLDGGDLYLLLTRPAAPLPASDGIALDDPAHAGALDALGLELVRWFDALYLKPADSESSPAWKPPQLEYEFACSAPRGGAERVLAADEYYHGHLDWYSFDHDAASDGLGAVADAPPAPEATHTQSFIPAPVEFDGMPDTRWWALEDRKTSFGDVKPSTTDLAQLLLVEFGLVYANDWFVLPFRLAAGTLAHVEGMAVTNTFGERFWIEAAGKGSDQDWHRWSMFTLSVKGSLEVPADTSLFLPPAIAKGQEGAPQEEVYFIRDEMANMVWAVETVVPLVGGHGGSGKDAALETLRYHEALVNEGNPAPVLDYQAPISYLAMTTVPENWIPFVPVHVPNSNREVQLQRSRMLRIIEGAGEPFPKVPPLTTLVREGLDAAAPAQYFVHEEEVPRAGVRVTQSFQRTRWTSGQAYVWLGARKQAGRGERSSGLAFDTIVNAPPETP